MSWGKVVIDMSMSLDGYIAAPNDNPEQGLGEDGMRLHNWAFDKPSVFERVYGNIVENTSVGNDPVPPVERCISFIARG